MSRASLDVVNCAGVPVQVRYRNYFFFQAEDGIRDADVTGVQTCALPISSNPPTGGISSGSRPRVAGRSGRDPPSGPTRTSDLGRQPESPGARRRFRSPTIPPRSPLVESRSAAREWRASFPCVAHPRPMSARGMHRSGRPRASPPPHATRLASPERHRRRSPSRRAPPFRSLVPARESPVARSPSHRSAARHDEAFVFLPALVQLLDFVRRRVARQVSESRLPDVTDPVRRAGGGVRRRLRPEDFLLVTRRHLPASLEDLVHRFDPAVFVDPRPAPGPDLDDGDQELPRTDVAPADDLVRKALVAFQGLRALALHDLHGPAARPRGGGHLEFPQRPSHKG